jgi:hypothetical protein
MPKVGEDLSREQRLAGQKRLTDKQQAFLDNFMHKDMTQTSAARSAGYANPGVMLFACCVTQSCKSDIRKCVKKLELGSV